MNSEIEKIIAKLSEEKETARVELSYARNRISELNEIIRGDRPDLFHDSVIRGSRVARMEELTSTMHQIIDYIVNEEMDNAESKLTAIKHTLSQTLTRETKE